MPEGRGEGKPQLVNMENRESDSLHVSTEGDCSAILSPWVRVSIIYSSVIASCHSLLL